MNVGYLILVHTWRKIENQDMKKPKKGEGSRCRGGLKERRLYKQF